MSPRAIRVLADVAVIAAEDTRRTLQLLRRFDITTKLISNHAFNERARQDTLLQLLAEGDVALVTDAGTPAISDPGTLLVDAALSAGHAVVAVPGPSALTAAISISGLVEGPVTFLGFLPRKAKERDDLLRRVNASGFAFALFEAANRAADALEAIAALDGDRRVAVVRELTKVHEEIARGSAEALAKRFRDAPPRGEIVIVVEAGAPETADPDAADRAVAGLIRGGMRASDAAKYIAASTGLARSDLYRRAIQSGVSRTESPTSDDA
jgi:16S rRNA (cytidine1402-2'-O)-methyltransferase